MIRHRSLHGSIVGHCFSTVKPNSEWGKGIFKIELKEQTKELSKRKKNKRKEKNKEQKEQKNNVL